MQKPHELQQQCADMFEVLRPRLIRIAYRMIGTHAEAEDIVQDAWLRLNGADVQDIRNVEAWLVRVVSRLALDYLKSARVKRETYPGMWLPEPSTGDEFDTSGDVTLALMVALDRLSPLERAAFLLHDVFDVDYDEIASVLDRDETACRQLASRARNHIRKEKPRFPVSEEQGRTIADAFLHASRSGDVTALQSLLADDVVMYSDGGGIRNAALNPIWGSSKVTRFFEGVSRKVSGVIPTFNRFTMFDGLPGYMTIEDDGLLQVTALEIENGKIQVIYLIRNPQKLQHLRF